MTPSLQATTPLFGVAMEADVKLDPNCKDGTDGFIDDGACAVLASPSNSRMVARGAQAALMSLFLVFRPLAAALEPIKRPNAPSLRKLEAEGMLREVITFLGWKIDTRAFTISLPEDKWINWRNEITMCLTRPHVTPEVLASLVGRLNHVCFVIPDARHFMNHLQKMKQVAEDRGRSIQISLGAKKDLQLWLQFLEYAASGISINLVVFRKPTLQSLSDASPWGIGGLSPTTLVGWRHEFTELKQRSFTMNCKEHIGVVVDSIIQAKYDTSKADFPCYLHRSDNTSAVGWMHKSNHDPDEAPIHNAISRFHASFMMSRKACHYSQHLPGIENVVTDCLSRDFHLSDAQITAMLTSVHPSLTNLGIKIVQVPEEVTSWIASLAQLKPVL